ncbi:unnamed protein product [Arctogadus glacialis]
MAEWKEKEADPDSHVVLGPGDVVVVVWVGVVWVGVGRQDDDVKSQQESGPWPDSTRCNARVGVLEGEECPPAPNPSFGQTITTVILKVPGDSGQAVCAAERVEARCAIGAVLAAEDEHRPGALRGVTPTSEQSHLPPPPTPPGPGARERAPRRGPETGTARQTAALP